MPNFFLLEFRFQGKRWALNLQEKNEIYLKVYLSKMMAYEMGNQKKFRVANG